jgi:microcystin-dependent protein
MKKTFLIMVLGLGLFGTPKAAAQATEPFIGQIIAVGFNFAPIGWAPCNGQLVPIIQNTALFSLLGTYYGGNGTTNFALPNLNGRTLIGTGQRPGGANVDLGEAGGASTTTVGFNNLPPHTHPLNADSNPGITNVPTNMVPANTLDNDQEYATSGNTVMSPTGSTGGTQPISTMQPYLGMYYIICTQGVFPPRP